VIRLSSYRNVGGICAALLALLAGVLVGCVTIPNDGRTLRGGADGEVTVTSASCAGEISAADRSVASVPLLDAAHLRVLSWNVHKTEDQGWRDDFERLAVSHDLLALQEAVSNDRLRAVLARAGYEWRLASAFQFLSEDAGVLTAARVPATGACGMRTTEPVTRIPKSALTTTYRLSGSGASLMVANLHGINFTLGTSAFREQIEALAAQLAAHQGPAILAGDFNTWSDARRVVLNEVTARAGLIAVPIADDHRTRFMGEAVDGVYYRGLEVIASAAFPVTSSDHNPVSVTFRLPVSQIALRD